MKKALHLILAICLFAFFQKAIVLTATDDKLIKSYDYDHNLPLNSEIKVEFEDTYYIRYHVFYDSANGERIPAHLYIPKVYNPTFSPEQKREIKFEQIRKKNSLAFIPPWPVAFFMHFHASDKGLAWLVASGEKGWAARGLAVFAIDGIYRGERKVEGKDILKGAPDEIAKNMRQQIFDILRGVDFLCSQPDIDKNRIGFMGISMGAITGTVAAGVDKRIKATSLVDGGGDFETFLLNSEYGSIKRLIKSMEDNSIPKDTLRETFRYEDPVFYAPFVSPRSVIMMNGKNDTTIPQACIQKLYNAFGEPKKILMFDSGHEDIPIQAITFESFKFFKEKL